MPEFTAQEYLRYTRHIQLPQVGAEGQLKLKKSQVVIVGCGGLGAPVSLYLAAAGVGNITLVDGDNIELTNLQRQITFTENDIGNNKALVTQQKLNALNSDITVNAIDENLSASNANAIFSNADIILDCSDNFTARYIINDSCKQLQKPWVYASVFQFSGQCAVFTPSGACFRCLFPEAPTQADNCNTGGVLGVLPGLLGTIQATEAIKYLLGFSDTLANKLLLAESLEMQFQTIALTQSNHCACCKQEQVESIANPPVNSPASDTSPSITGSQFIQYQNDESYILIDVRSIAERNAFNLEGIHIPHDKITSQHKQLNKNKTIIVYCQSGIRSAEACKQLIALGYKALNVDGGLASILKYKD